jgi:hypothetical protein
VKGGQGMEDDADFTMGVGEGEALPYVNPKEHP